VIVDLGVRVCMCVREGERDREGGRERGGVRGVK
jgi:hypothetical protein